MKFNKAIFLDRDGVLNRSLVRNGKPYAPILLKDFHILSGVKKTLKYLKKKNYLLIVITNQPDIKSGKLKLNKLLKMNNILINKLKINEIFICKHDDRDCCNCRKPKNQLIENAIKKYSIDRRKSFLIGDRKKDIEAGLRSRLKTIYINKNYKESKPKNFDFECDNIKNALFYIDNF